jgi:glycosyltransferase involved in cell wall biosynthesis
MKYPLGIVKMQHKKINLLICGHDLKFINPFIQEMEALNEFEVKILEHKGHLINDPIAAERDLLWANVIFCEWALGNAVWFSERKRPDQVLIVRLHLQEVQARDRIDFIWQTNWKNVDRLILITQHIYDWMIDEFPTLAGKSALVYNPIPAATLLNRPKSINTRFTLGLVGVVPARKRLDLAIDILRKLRRTDQRYTLRVKGSLPTDYPWMANRKEEMAWYNNIFSEANDLISAGSIIFDPHSPDMAAWYQQIGHILSVSDFEGSHQAVAEGMASGCVPTIRNWEGADRMYPPKFVGQCITSLSEMVIARSEISEFNAASDYCKEYAITRFDNKPTCQKLLGILIQELRQKNLLINEKYESFRARLFTPTILIIAYVPIGSRSGYRIRVEQEIKVLTQQGCIVHLACLSPRAKDVDNTEDITKLQNSHLAEFKLMGCTPHLIEVDNFFALNINSNSFPNVISRLEQIVDVNKIDVIHAEALYCARVASQLKARRNIIIFSIDWHGIVPEESRMGGAHESRILALEVEEKKLLQEADLNVFVSKSMHTHYHQKYGHVENNHAIVPCCVGDNRFIDSSQKPPSDMFPSDSIIFGYAGTMADWQCGREMVALFSDLHKINDKCRFLLLIPAADQSCAKAYCMNAGLPAEAMIMTEVSHDDVPKWLSICHVGVMIRRPDPVNFVSSPTKFAEYLAVGLPILMTDAVGDYGNLSNIHDIGFVLESASFFNENNEQPSSLLLQEIISFAQRSATEHQVIAKRCKTIAREILHWESSATKWIEKFHQL